MAALGLQRWGSSCCSGLVDGTQRPHICSLALYRKRLWDPAVHRQLQSPLEGKYDVCGQLCIITHATSTCVTSVLFTDKPDKRVNTGYGL